MPLGGSLTSSDKQVIENWIMAMTTSSTPPGPSTCSFSGQTVSSGSSVLAYQSASVPAGQACVSQNRTCTNGQLSGNYAFSSCSVGSGTSVSFQTLEATIIQPNCAGCHSNFGSYSGIMSIVNVGSPTSSLIYTYTTSGAMPRGGSPLTSSEESQILQWIQAGAPNN